MLLIFCSDSDTFNDHFIHVPKEDGHLSGRNVGDHNTIKVRT